MENRRLVCLFACQMCTFLDLLGHNSYLKFSTRKCSSFTMNSIQWLAFILGFYCVGDGGGSCAECESSNNFWHFGVPVWKKFELGSGVV